MAELPTFLIDGQDVSMPALRAYLTRLSDTASSALLSSIDGAVPFATLALAQAAPATTAGRQARVYADPVAAKNGVYVNVSGGVGGYAFDTAFYNQLAAVIQPLVTAAQDAAAASLAARTVAEAAATSLAPLVPAFSSTTRPVAANGTAYGARDTDGRALNMIDGAGDPVHAAHYAEALARQAGFDKTQEVYARQPKHTLFSSTMLAGRTNFISIIYGQSNAQAANSVPALSTAASAYGNLKHPAGTTGPLVALKEETFESCATAFADSASARLEKFLRPWDSYSRRWIMVNGGAAGTALAGLVKGTAPYTELMAKVQNAVSQLPAGSVAVAQMIVLHGENDSTTTNSGAGIAPQVFADGWKGILNDVTADVFAMTGQTLPVIATIGIMGHGTATDTTTPAGNFPTTEGWRLLAEQDARFHICSVGYTKSSIDAQHYTNLGERHLGDEHARAAHCLFDLKIKPPELRVASVQRVSVRVVKLAIDTSKWWVPPIEFDTLKVLRTPGYGFNISRSGAAVAIADVRIDNSSTEPAIYISTATDLAAGDVVSAGFTIPTNGIGFGPGEGARVCIRDSDRSVSYTLDESGYPNSLFNWLTPFSLMLA